MYVKIKTCLFDICCVWLCVCMSLFLFLFAFWKICVDFYYDHVYMYDCEFVCMVINACRQNTVITICKIIPKNHQDSKKSELTKNIFTLGIILCAHDIRICKYYNKISKPIKIVIRTIKKINYIGFWYASPKHNYLDVKIIFQNISPKDVLNMKFKWYCHIYRLGYF